LDDHLLSIAAVFKCSIKSIKCVCNMGEILLEPLMEGTHVMYPYLKFHKYRMLVSQLAGTHMIPVTHRYDMFPHGAISPDC
jgi:hypothetical protein